ncbi:chitin synthase [Mytilus galloprovincialis]|uniref:chitin synthase n=1 Tax=Mytilus galloprovincialis TaxID=29158 RepID=A0A8B6CIR1_MYTGA|nr:chitin synthase [Mytilus galloprovincialis]
MAEKSEYETQESRRLNRNILKTIKAESKGKNGHYGDKRKFKIKLPSSANPLREKILKIIFAIFLLVVVFGSCFIARISLHILIWHITPPIETSDSVINTLGGLLVSNCSFCVTSNTTTCSPHSTVDKTWIWALFLAIIAPYLLTFFTTLFRVSFKLSAPLNCGVLVLVLLIETIHSIGISILAFLVLPVFDPASASVVYLAVAVLPSMFDFIDKWANARKKDGTKDKSKLFASIYTSRISFVLPFFGFILQIAGIILISLYIKIGWLLGMFIISAIFTSIRHWENYVTIDGNSSKLLMLLHKHKGRTEVACLVSFWKIIVTFIAVIVIFTSQGHDSTSSFKSLFSSEISKLTTAFGDPIFGNNAICENRTPFIVAVISICCEYICYKASKTVCEINCQRAGFSIPLTIVPIATTLTLVSMMHQPDILKFSSCDLLFSTWCVKGFDQLVENCTELFVAFFVLICSILLITRHIWKVNGIKYGETSRMFVSNFYCGLFIDLSLLLNRRRNYKEYSFILSQDVDTKTGTVVDDKRQNKRRMVFACATMWHETANEMTHLLKSILRLDLNQFINSYMADLFLDVDKLEDSYDLEVQVFFDDAFDHLNEGEKYPRVNCYVKTFIECINKAGSLVYGTELEVASGMMFRTPYGAIIEWILPGENKMIAHLKDRTKVRQGKRWSQVMYMYYISQWCLQKKHGELGKQAALDNTFLLALDGDVDFEPEAVLSLMRRMNKSKIVGAACGRIHPIGSGPIIWYQKFEYAISHWFQKATEHVIGSVLCSTGCFSLFRGSALMQPEVLQKYTTIANEDSRFVQYDRNGDRWLCTLLLKQGWKVEYCAESDAYTFAPERFSEFYDQRRRWIPYTLAYILDIILDWKKVTKINENISFLYIVYQMFLFISTLITPGIIFMMILGAIIVGFDAIPLYLSLILNLVPVGSFLLMTLYASSQRQLKAAAVLSSIYVIVMMIVLIGVVKEAIDEGLCSITTICILLVPGVFVVSALVHPKEFVCIIHGLLYVMAIPSMSMLMFLYSIGNIHTLSLGTFETKQASDNTKADKKNELEKERKGYFMSQRKCFSCMFGETNDYNKDDFPGSNKNEVKDVREIINTKEGINKYMDVATVHHGIHVSRDEWELRPDHFVLKIPKQERKFWKRHIKKYLKPTYVDLQEFRKKRLQLKELRNRVCFFVYLLNAILISGMFVLTQVNASRDALSIEIDCSVGTIQLVPIAILFMAVFGTLLLLQFVCMLYHRLTTLVHICATTELWKSDVTHRDQRNSKLTDFLIQAPTSTPFVRTHRIFKNSQEQEEERLQAQVHVRKAINLKDFVKANLEEAPLTDHSLLHEMNKLNNIDNQKTVRTDHNLSKDKKKKHRFRENKIVPVSRTKSLSSSSDAEDHISKSDNTNGKFGRDCNV